MTSKSDLKPCVFFDRDGVLNVDTGYAFEPAKLKWVEGALAAVKATNDAGFLAIVVTNQSGIARGYYSVEQMHEFHAAMQSDLKKHGAGIDAFYFCPYHSEGSVLEFVHPNHHDRKPNPGMILRAMADFNIDPALSFLVGDHVRDVEAAHNANVAGHLFSSGRLDDLVIPLLERTLA